MLYYLGNCILELCQYNYSTSVCQLAFCYVLFLGCRSGFWIICVCHSKNHRTECIWLGYFTNKCYACTSLRNCWLKPVALFKWKATKVPFQNWVRRKSPLAVSTESVTDCPQAELQKREREDASYQAYVSNACRIKPRDKPALWKMSVIIT